MTAGVSATIGFAAAVTVSLVLTPLAARVARRMGFYDCPREYRRHEAPTPFLGGAAVLLSVLGVAALVGATSHRLFIILVCAAAMWAMGTLDDWLPVAPRWRVLLAVVCGVALEQSGFGWHTTNNHAVNLILTVLWIVTIVNAFNLMDNLDGACASVASVAGACIGVLAILDHHAGMAGLAFALSGACIGFLRFNLARPARIFLGDGGSMTIGFLVAALSMATATQPDVGHAGLLVGGLLAGLPLLDVALVIMSRLRRRVKIVTGGRDHLTHRILLRLGTARRVAATLAIGQAVMGGLAIFGSKVGADAIFASSFTIVTLGITLIAVLDTARWRPAGIASGPLGSSVPSLRSERSASLQVDG